MAKLVYGLSQSLDGYVDHQNFAAGPSLFRHFIEHVRDLSGVLYGRRTYEIMRYWDEDLPGRPRDRPLRIPTSISPWTSKSAIRTCPAISR